MHALLLAAALAQAPAPPQTVDLSPSIRAQRAATMHAIHIQIQAALEQRGARFFAAGGDLETLLDAVIVVETELAAR